MSKKILTVDDSKPIRMIIQRAFRSYDCQIVEAADGVEGLTVARRERPDLIILDLTMPVMDGFEMLTRLKSAPDLKDIPVIMLTAEAGKDNVLRIAKLGVRGYLVKPFKDEAIVEKVTGVIPLDLQGAAGKAPSDEIRLLVVDDKPAIIEQFRKAVADTAWKVEAAATPAEALALCDKIQPSTVIASLSLPDGAAFTLFKDLRARPAGKTIPLLGICLVSATADQEKARLQGVTQFINKPIISDAVKNVLTRALNIDTTSKYFEEANGELTIQLPSEIDSFTENKLALKGRQKLSEAVENGVTRFIIDMRPVQAPDMRMIELVVSLTAACKELSLEYTLVGNETVKAECSKYQESQGWEIQEASAAVAA